MIQVPLYLMAMFLCRAKCVIRVKWARSVCGVLSHQIHVAVFLLYIHHGSTSPVYRNCHLHLTNTVHSVLAAVDKLV